MSNIKEKIKETYSLVVNPQKQSSGCCGSVGGCCGNSPEFSGFNENYENMPGYNPDADFGLGCGLPVQFANIMKGDTVLDLGSGAGNDAFVARSLAGDTGKVIGVDMTEAMVEKATKNKSRLGYSNVEFILGDIENLPFPENYVDVVISNCVLNLVSDKRLAFDGILKVLKPGGHFSISDIVLSGPLSDKMINIAELYAGCISGAMVKDEYIATIRESGFNNIEIKKEKKIILPDDFLLQYLSTRELENFRESGVQILSITVNGVK